MIDVLTGLKITAAADSDTQHRDPKGRAMIVYVEPDGWCQHRL
jgi:hypothetical protein